MLTPMRSTFLIAGAIVAAAALSGCSGGGGGGDDDDDDGPIHDPLTGSWTGGFALPGPSGAGAQVFAATMATDGRIVVGGAFTQVGAVPAASVAAWDGAAWSPLGGGLPGIVRALAVDSSGTLFAGGELGNEVEPNRLFAFDGAGWNALPGDIEGSVSAIAVHGTSLLVGGSFDDAGGSGAISLARFSNGAWTNLAGSGVVGQVKSIVPVDADSFCIGGGFIEVDGVETLYAACSDAGVWTQLGDGLPGEATVLTRDLAGDWLAGGTLTFIVDPMTGDYEAGLAKLVAGTWSPLAGGVDGGFINDVRAIHVAANGDLVVGGTFGTVGPSDVSASNIARLTPGGVWSEEGGGVFNLVGVFLGTAIGVNVIIPGPDGGELLAGGVFSHAGGTVASNLAVTSGGVLVATVPPGPTVLGLSGFADAITFDANGDLIAAGAFLGAGSLPVANVARFRAGAWEPLGDGISDGTVRALAVLDDGVIVAGGDFAALRRFDGTEWTAFAGGVATVFVLAEAGDGSLYASGEFDEFISRWNGSEWRSLDGGLDARATSITFDSRGRMVAGGLFQQSASGVTLNGIGRYSGGEWHAYGGGLDGGDFGYVSDVATMANGDLVIAGSFGQVDGVAVTSLARWDGNAWSAIGPLPLLFDLPPTIVGLEPYGDGFFLTGTFLEIPSGPASYIAWYDGASFHPLDEGLSDLAEEMRVHGSTLWAGGAFVEAGGAVSSGIAAWDFTPSP